MIDKDKKIGYVRITSFIQNTADELQKALDQLKEEGVKGLILDLRDNPGGLLGAAVEISDLFLEKGKVVSTEGAEHDSQVLSGPEGQPVRGVAHGRDDQPELGLGIGDRLGRLQDNKRATIIGQRSYGKGSVQNIIELEDGNSVLKLTVASYHRPNGDNIHRFRDSKTTDKWGVSPNPGMEIKLSPSEYIKWFVGRRDRDLKSAAKGHSKTVQPKPEADKDKEKATTKEAEKTKTDDKDKPRLRIRTLQRDPGPFVDKVLDKALDVIKAKIGDQQKAKAA